MALGPIVAFAALLGRRLLPVAVAAFTRCILVGAEEGSGMLAGRQPGLPKAGWRMARLACPTIVIAGRLVAISARRVATRLHWQAVSMTCKAGNLCVAALQYHWVVAGADLSPGLGGLVACAARNGWCWLVWAYVAGIAVGKVGAELPFLVAVEADGHGADELATNWVKAVAHAAVAVAAGDAHALTVGHRVVGRAQAILGELGRQIWVACQADVRLAQRWIDDDAFVGKLDILCPFLPIVAGDTTDRAVYLFWGLVCDGQICHPFGGADMGFQACRIFVATGTRGDCGFRRCGGVVSRVRPGFHTRERQRHHAEGDQTQDPASKDNRAARPVREGPSLPRAGQDGEKVHG
jgi:hypothetical protein